MIAVDTSVLIAILLDEPDAARYIEALRVSASSLLSAASYVETCAVMTKRTGPEGIQDVNDLIASSGIEVAPLTSTQGELAAEAFSRYGVLNFGDAFSYALAKDTGRALLFKGNDFSKTDLPSVL